MRRGQAVVETALSTLVIVTVIAFGIHFAEVGYASIKVHEATAFAMWDATGRPIHSLPGSTLSGYEGAAAGRANGRYADFDSRPGSTGASSTQALTRAEGLQVGCAPSGGLRGPPPPGVAGGVLPDTGGTACSASAVITAIRIPHRFVEGGGGFFNKGAQASPHLQRDAYLACGLGRSRYGSCNGQLGILLGDWALSMPGQEASCPGNGSFESAASTIWSNNGGKQGNDAENFATKYAGYSPYDLPFVIQNDTFHTLTVPPGSPGQFLPPP